MAAFAIALAGACAGSSTSDPVVPVRSAPTDQVVSGRAELATFPSPITSVRAVRAGQVVVASNVAADGNFSLSIPPNTGYRIEMVSAEHPTLVYPRRAGTLDVAFDVRGSGTFDLGAVRFIGDPSGKTFRHSPAPGQAGGGADNSECQNGVDPTTGAVCVDDDSQEGAGECSAGGDHSDCQNGVDPNTGAPCTDDDQNECENGVDPSGAPCVDDDQNECENGVDPSGAPCTDDDQKECENGVDPNGAPCTDDDQKECENGVDPNGAPCTDDDQNECENGVDPSGAPCVDDDQNECKDGIDPNTGAECDGGPSQNQDDGEQEDSKEGDDGEQNDDMPAAAAVADHNLPASVGCQDGNPDGVGQDH